MLTWLPLNIAKTLTMLRVQKEEVMNVKQMKEVVKQLKGASRMHAQQAAKIERMIKSMAKTKKK